MKCMNFTYLSVFMITYLACVSCGIDKSKYSDANDISSSKVSYNIHNNGSILIFFASPVDYEYVYISYNYGDDEVKRAVVEIRDDYAILYVPKGSYKILELILKSADKPDCMIYQKNDSRWVDIEYGKTLSINFAKLKNEEKWIVID